MSDRTKTTAAFLRLSPADQKVDEEYLETALAESLTWTHPHGEPDAYAHEIAIAFVKMREELESWRKGEIAHSLPATAKREPLVQEVIAALGRCEPAVAAGPNALRLAELDVLEAVAKLAEWKP